MQLLDQARAALSKHDWNAALRVTDSHAERFATSFLGEEREAIAVKALAGASRVAQARARMVRFEAAFPRSPPQPTDSEPPPPGPALTEWLDPTACVTSESSDLTGVWVGAFESGNFQPVESLRIEIFGASATQGVCGSASIGDNAPPPPPPTDPTTAYPPDADLVGYYLGLYAGAVYTLRNGAMRGDSVYFELDSIELWKDWCALQPTMYVPQLESWLCVPANGFTSDGETCRIVNLITGHTEVLPFVQCMACRPHFGTCVCNESGCTANPNNGDSPRTEFQLERTGDLLSGTTDGQSEDVVLERAD